MTKLKKFFTDNLSINIKISLMLVVIMAVASTFISIIVYYVYLTDSVRYKEQVALGIARSVSAFIDGDQFKALDAAGEKTDYYYETQPLIEQAQINSGITYLYAIVDNGDGENYRYLFDAEGEDLFGNLDPIEGYGAEKTFATGEPVIDMFNLQYGEMIAAFAPIRDSGGQIVGVMGADITLSDVYRELNQFIIRGLVVLLLFNVGFVLLVRSFLKFFIINPMVKITNIADSIANGNLNIAFDETDKGKQPKDEIGILNNALKRMLMEMNQNHTLKLIAVEAKFEKEKTESASKAQYIYFANMSHEIRTPMNAIVGITELVLRADITPAVREHVLGIKNAGNNLLSIINDILDFSKIESGKLELMTAEYVFASLINDVINIIRTRTFEKQVIFIVNLNSAIPHKLIGDEVRLRQILINLLNNAAKYTHEGFIALTIDSVPQGEDSVLLSIEVSDSGIGIKPEDLNKLFENFKQVDAITNKGVQGTGLGLAITKNLCHIMGGDISVYSEYGKGSTFTALIPQRFSGYEKFAAVSDPACKKVLLYETREIYANSIACSVDNLGVECVLTQDEESFISALKVPGFSFVFVSSFLFERAKNIVNELGITLPLVLLAEYGEVIADKKVKTIAMPVHSISIANILNDVTDNAGYGGGEDINITFSAPSASVLVVDDIVTNLKVAEGLMAPYNMRIDTCLSGRAALSMVMATRYDIIFMDHMMPEMDGIEATRRIRALDGEYFLTVPIIALTANAVPGIREVFLQNGMNDFLAKPIEMSKLGSTLEQWIPREKKENHTIQKKSDNPAVLEIEGLDVNAGVIGTGGNLSHYLKTLALFSADSRERIKKITDAADEPDRRLYITYVHALKSALGSIGARELSELAGKLEEAGRNGNTAFIAQENKTFLHKLQTLLTQIDKAVSERQAEGGPRDVIDKTTMAALRQAFEEMDASTAGDILKKLRELKTDKAQSDAIEMIYTHFLMFEYDEAIAVIDGLADKQEGL